MLKIGVLGAGHLGKIHLNCIKQIDKYNLIGFFDPVGETAKQVEAELNVHCFNSIDDLIDAVDVVDIVTPTIRHFECASKALQKRKHVFIEKPIVATPEEANALKKLADEAGVKVQVGHVERFNPAFIAAEPLINEPLFIEAHRMTLTFCSPLSSRLSAISVPAVSASSVPHPISPMCASSLRTERWPTSRLHACR